MELILIVLSFGLSASVLFCVQFFVPRNWQWRLVWTINGLAAIVFFAWFLAIYFGYDEVGRVARTSMIRVLRDGVYFFGLFGILPLLSGTVLATLFQRWAKSIALSLFHKQ